MIKVKRLIYYTDGSCWPNPGPGGYAVVDDQGEVIKMGGEPISTNVRMEGQAIIQAMREAEGLPLLIRTDSMLWRDILMEYAPRWKKNGWYKKPGERGWIKNLLMVKEAFELYEKTPTVIQWVRGHNGDPGNELADAQAEIARQETITRYPNSAGGSIHMLAEAEEIRRGREDGAEAGSGHPEQGQASVERLEQEIRDIIGSW